MKVKNLNQLIQVLQKISRQRPSISQIKEIDDLEKTISHDLSFIKKDLLKKIRN
jgi:hypothetical protein